MDVINESDFNYKEYKEVYSHSSAHILALAIKRLYPDVIMTIGPATETGFYYDFDNLNLQKEDLKKIEREMRKILKEKIPFKKEIVSKSKALEIFKDNPYKVEIINDLDDSEEISIYFLKELVDLCRGPHIEHTGMIGAIKPIKIAGAYWRGDSKNKMLTRVYGVSFPTKEELKANMKMLEEAKLRDHRVLGKKLDLFVQSEVVGRGLPLLTPKGALIKKILQDFVYDEETKRGYQFTDTPVLTKSKLYEISGHLDHYRDSMFVFEVDGEEVCLRPMTCPHQFMIYKSKPHSYKELPIRYSEFATLFRREQSGELGGLIRLWEFTLADAHILCTPEQVEDEFRGVVELVEYIMDTLGIDEYHYRFSKWDPEDKKGKYVNEPKSWERTQKLMKEILDNIGAEYVEAEGEAAFYGPKLDVQMKNVHGKEETAFTVQIDFALPKRFELTYKGADDKEHEVMIVHRSSIGCFERTMALLIEKYAGKFPLWLSPEQVKIVPVSESFENYAKSVELELREWGIRADADLRDTSMNRKIRDHEKAYVNYILIVGEREESNKSVNMRIRDTKEQKDMSLDRFKELVKKESSSRTLKSII